MNEIEEFYSYIEMPQIAENLRAWEGSFTAGMCYNALLVSIDNLLLVSNAEWTKAPLSQRRTHVELLLESLEHRDAEIRFTNARRIFYVLQGIIGFAIHQYIYKAHIKRYFCGNCLSGTSIALDIRELQSGAVCKWHEHHR
jgi:hypothetical protein